jgi:predicted deacylase
MNHSDVKYISTAIGTAIPHPGTIQYGRWEALQHPTGHVEFLPVILAQGKEPGPCLWLTAGIHGSEQAGPLVIYKLLTQELVDQLRGTIVAIPALNPAGLRTMKREPYHAATDPNRLWPDGKPSSETDPYQDPPSSLELAYKRLFDELIDKVDYMIDYHNAWTGSISFAFRDRIFYKENEHSQQNKLEAEALSNHQLEMLQAYGHTIITEMPANHLIDQDLHRATSGAVLLLGRIPAITVELSTGHMPDPAVVNAAVAGTRNILRWAGMLGNDTQEREPIEGIPVIHTEYPVRRCPTPRVQEACVVVHLRQPGDYVKTGDVVAEIRDIWGRVRANGMIFSEYDGFIIGRAHGILYYPGDAIYSMAIKDDAPYVVPYPADYFTPPGKDGQ